MSGLDGLFYRRLWPGPLPVRVEAEPPATPAPEEPAPAVSPLLSTSFADTVPDVAAAEHLVEDRLADLVCAGLSPLEAARKLFIDGEA
ncbi:MAG TPA: hypothetical protein VIP77_15505 [Jiangellaceae bacterium]